MTPSRGERGTNDATSGRGVGSVTTPRGNGRDDATLCSGVRFGISKLLLKPKYISRKITSEIVESRFCPMLRFEFILMASFLQAWCFLNVTDVQRQRGSCSFAH